MAEEIKDDQPVSPTYGTMKRLCDRDKELAGKSRPTPLPLGIQGDRAFRYGLVTQQIGARSGFNLGTGKIKLHYDSNGVLTPYSPDLIVDCRNLLSGTNGPIVVGSWVIAGIVDGKFSAFVAEC